MKFFNSFLRGGVPKKYNTKKYNISCYSLGLGLSTYSNILCRLLKNGLHIKYSRLLANLILIFNYELFIYQLDFGWVGRMNFSNLLNTAVDLIKPPFVIQTTTVPKKLKRKIKLKYLIKIVYKGENLRAAIALKQLINNCTTFSDIKLKYRLYKSILTTFLQTTNSNLFKKKLLIFKKFFKN